MKSVCILLSAGLVSLVAGCSSTPVVLAPVGPNPAGSEKTAWNGELQVFSSVAEQTEDQNQASNDFPVWYQHTDYSIYTPAGKLVKHVDNTIGQYERAPRRVALPAGQYLVKAQAKDYRQVELTVTIERGRTTRAHLDGNWKLPAATPKNELVAMPNGQPVGWRAQSTRETGIN